MHNTQRTNGSKTATKTTKCENHAHHRPTKSSEQTQAAEAQSQAECDAPHRHLHRPRHLKRWHGWFAARSALLACWAAGQAPRHLLRPGVRAPGPDRKTTTTGSAISPATDWAGCAVVIKSHSGGLPVSASTQPTMMSVMLSQLGLAAGHRVLEIGSGTGYNAALIARIVGDQKSAVTIDVVPELIGQARVNLTAAGYGCVTVVCGDGAAGVPDHAPYDRVIVTTGTWDLATQWWAQLGPT